MGKKIKFVPQEALNNTSLSPLMVIEAEYHRFLILAPHDVRYQIKRLLGKSSQPNVWTDGDTQEYDSAFLNYVFRSAIQEYWVIDDIEYEKVCDFFMEKALKKGSKNPFKFLGLIPTDC